MSSIRVRKLVPRFRRQNEHLVDADDQEAQALIEKDLQSHFTWTSDLTTEDSKYEFDFQNNNDENENQQGFIDDENNQSLSYDIENNQQLWNINIQDNQNETIKWNDDDQQQQKQINLSIEDQQNKQKWSLNENNNQSSQFNLNGDSNQQFNKQHFDTINQNKQQIFIQGESFRDQMKFAIDESSNSKENILVNNEETISIDCSIPSIDCVLSLPQIPIIMNWLQGIAEYKLSIPVQQLLHEYSPLTNKSDIEIDCEDLKSLKWSIEFLKENLVRSYLISLPNCFRDQEYSLPEQFHLNLSLNEEINGKEQLFSLIDLTFKQTLNLSSSDIKDQLLSIIDSIEIKQNFGNDEQFELRQWSLQELKIVIQNISPIEFIDLIYSPNDVKPIEFENLFIECDEGSARAFRRHRCKYMSIKTDLNYQLDSQQESHLQFNGNQQNDIEEQQQIQNDLDQQDTFKDSNIFIHDDNNLQCYDIIKSESSSSINVGPCLYRCDYECNPPSLNPRFRREIGFMSFDGSLENPIYYLDKSYKRFVHLPKDRNNCSLNVYEGYQQFIDKIRLNPRNYFRAFDSTDLRHLLHWYSEKQYLFSSNQQHLLKPPTFICRRTVLRTIISNLYYDSEPWKLLVCRIKGQFYLALANKQSKNIEEMTEDEYSGYRFEQLLTTNQPNTTRFKQDTTLHNPLQQFHTVRYWQFGEFNILYSNEIDGEIRVEQQDKKETSQKTDNSTTSKSIKTDQVENEIPEEDLTDESKRAQIEENLQLIKTDESETIVNKKKVNEFELKSGHIEMKCTNKKIFYRDENRLKTLHWWSQMWLANIDTLLIGYKTSNDGSIDQLDLFSLEQFISKFYSKYNLYLKYCFSYLHSFLNLIEKTVHIDDPNTIHQFTYIPQPLEIDPLTGNTLQVDLPKCVPFRYTQIKRSNTRHHNFMPQHYLDQILRTNQNENIQQIKTLEQETKKRIGHRGRTNCLLKQQKQIKRKTKEFILT